MDPVSPLAPERFPALPAVAGVRLACVAAGLKYAGRDDLLLADLAEGTQAAALFTQSKIVGAPVTWCRDALALNGGAVRGLVVNAGNANVYTGLAGEEICVRTAREAARLLGCAPEQVLLSSTGVIGELLPVERLLGALPTCAEKLGTADLQDATKCIGTTDTFPKGAGATAEIDGQSVHIAGIAKGAGMIEPHMATMLAYIFTDAAIAADALQVMLADVNSRSFNCITVDGDTSTSDTICLFATGRAEHLPVTDAADPRLASFKAALEEVMVDLAKQIAGDGEGAQKRITVTVTGAISDDEAKIAAKAVANSPLVKTAIAGEDANWGRLLMAIGKSGVEMDTQALQVWIGDQLVAEKGRQAPGYSEAAATAHIKNREVDVAADLGVGAGTATVWTCDLTHGYISINAEYRS